MFKPADRRILSFLLVCVACTAGCAREAELFHQASLGGPVPEGLRQKRETLLAQKRMEHYWSQFLGANRYYSGAEANPTYRQGTNADTVLVWVRDGKVFDRRFRTNRQSSMIWPTFSGWHGVDTFRTRLVWEFEIPPEFLASDTSLRRILLKCWWPEPVTGSQGYGYYPFDADMLTSDKERVHYLRPIVELTIGDCDEPRELVDPFKYSKAPGVHCEYRLSVKLTRTSASSVRVEWNYYLSTTGPRNPWAAFGI